jgi:ABC-type nitrate/sulfonate/bicarbonate transport system permease component
VAYMVLSGLVGYAMDRLVLVAESMLIRWKR